MGRRSRNRDAPPPVVPASSGPAPPRTPRVKAPREEAPQAPWHPLPLTETAIFVGLVLVVVAVVAGGDARPVLLFGGLIIIAVAALEQAIREHFAGYRSHSLLLAAVAGLGAAAPLWFAPLRQEILIAVFVLVAAFSFRALRGVFVSKSGGLSWRA